MSVEVYRGKYVTARDARSLFDVDTIVSCCESLNSVSAQLNDIREKLVTAKTYCCADSFYVGSLTYEGMADEVISNFGNVTNSVNGFTDQVINALQLAIDRKQYEFNEYARLDDLEYIRREEQNNSYEV